MLLPTSANQFLTAAPRSVSTSDHALTRPNTRLPVSSPPTRPSDGSRDLAAEIAERLEQDLDYQILRKSFALDTKDSIHRSSDRTTSTTVERNFRAADVGGRSVVFDLHLGDGSIESAGFDLQSSWSQESIIRFELSVSSTDSNIALRYESLQRQSIQLDLRQGDSAPVQTSDPLVLDLSGRGITTTGVEAGVQFDLTGDGQVEQVSFVIGDSWFLALDRNDNGQIDHGQELFGDQNGAAHGFGELARYDGNTDGVIDANDEVFSRLRLFQIGSDGEQILKTLAEADVTAIELGYQNIRKALNVYDRVAQAGQFQRADGSMGEASDVLLGYRGLA